MSMGKRLSAEFLGTFWLVLGGCGSAVLAAKFGGDGNPLGIGFLGVALAFGLTVVTGAYAFGHISGAHFNPAVSVGLWAGGRFPTRDLVPYIIAQVAGGLLAGFILLQIASGATGFAIDGSQAGAFACSMARLLVSSSPVASVCRPRAIDVRPRSVMTGSSHTVGRRAAQDQ